jgi:oligoendopeptidase F
MWYEILHLYMWPFYMIDYALAQLVAMQLALIDATDHDGAMATYIDLCRLGGTLSFAEAVAKAGLRSPFDEDVVAELAAHAAREMRMAEVA